MNDNQPTAPQDRRAKKYSWVNIAGVALIVGGFLWVAPAVRASYPWWQLKFGIYPYAKDAPAIAEGKRLYEARCQSCHGAKGDLSEHYHSIKEHIPMHNPGSYYQIITEGEPKHGMPAFGRSLSEQERWKLVAYIFSMAPKRK